MVTQQPRTGTRLEHVLALGVLAWRDKYLAWVRRHPLVVDAALVAALLWLSGPHVARISSSSQLWALALAPALLLPLVWRRRAPFLVFMIISIAVLAQLLTSQEVTDDLALLVAFYTIAAYQSPRRILAAAAILEAGAVLFAADNSPAGIHALWVWVFASGLVAATAFIGCYTRTRRAYLASLAGRAERLERDRERDAQLAASAERARIAREMHDIVAHNIAVMIALADGAAYTAADSPDQAVTLMGHVSDTGRSALTEALTNTLKHAAAASAQVHITYLAGEVGLEVTDDGQLSAGSAAGHGIAGMRERAAVFGGQVSAGPYPGGGWRVYTVLRIDPAPAGSGRVIGTEVA